MSLTSTMIVQNLLYLVVAVAISIILSMAFTKRYQSSSLAEPIATICIVFGLTISFTAMFAVGLDVYTSSHFIDPSTGGRYPWATDAVVDSLMGFTKGLYFTLLTLGLITGILLTPFTYFYVEEGEEDTTRWRRIGNALKFTAIAGVAAGLLTIIGILVQPKVYDGVSILSDHDTRLAHEDGDQDEIRSSLDYHVEPFVYHDRSSPGQSFQWLKDLFARQGSEKVALFLMALLVVVGSAVYALFTAYGLASIPIYAVECARRLKRDVANERTNRTIAGEESGYESERSDTSNANERTTSRRMLTRTPTPQTAAPMGRGSSRRIRPLVPRPLSGDFATLTSQSHSAVNPHDPGTASESDEPDHIAHDLSLVQERIRTLEQQGQYQPRPPSVASRDTSHSDGTLIKASQRSRRPSERTALQLHALKAQEQRLIHRLVNDRNRTGRSSQDPSPTDPTQTLRSPTVLSTVNRVCCLICPACPSISNAWQKLQRRVGQPIYFAIGGFSLVMSGLVVASVIASMVDKAWYSECGKDCGYFMPRESKGIPLDWILGLMNYVSPMDYFAYIGLGFFLQAASLFGVVQVGIRFLWLRMYKIEKYRTQPQALLLASAMIMLGLLAQGYALVEMIAPNWTSWGGQRFCSVKGGCEGKSHLLVDCSFDAPEGACIPSVLSSAIHAMLVNTPLLGAAAYYTQVIFLLLYAFSTVIAIIRSQRHMKGLRPRGRGRRRRGRRTINSAEDSNDEEERRWLL